MSEVALKYSELPLIAITIAEFFYVQNVALNNLLEVLIPSVPFPEDLARATYVALDDPSEVTLQCSELTARSGYNVLLESMSQVARHGTKAIDWKRGNTCTRTRRREGHQLTRSHTRLFDHEHLQRVFTRDLISEHQQYCMHACISNLPSDLAAMSSSRA